MGIIANISIVNWFNIHLGACDKQLIQINIILKLILNAFFNLDIDQEFNSLE